MHEYEFEDAERADVPPNIHTVHAEPLNSVHCKEVTGYRDEMNKVIEDKVIIGNTEEETTLKNGQPAFSLYSDRTHLYTCRWIDWLKNRHRHVWRLGYSRRRTGLLLTSSFGQACCEERALQTLPGALSGKTVKDLIWLLFYVTPHL